MEPLIRATIPQGLRMTIVIPAYAEPALEASLHSLDNCIPVDHTVEVIVVLNDHDSSTIEEKELNVTSFNHLENFTFSNPCLNLNLIYLESLPFKAAGVGVARKTGMDESLRRFYMSGQENGIIVCLDADCTVDRNYLTSIIDYFNSNPDKEACSIHFEHVYAGDTSIHCQLYELHLRYYIEVQRWLKLPFAYQTVGSAMAVRAEAYAKEGGMPKRKAGEDFYFLHKFIRKNKCGEILNTVVYPSCRSSERVPFGTGKAIGSAMQGNPMLTYNIDAFIHLRAFLNYVLTNMHKPELLFDSNLYSLNPILLDFFHQMKLLEKWKEIKKHVASNEQFINRFFRWFDAFMLMKYAHFMRDRGISDTDIISSARKLLTLISDDKSAETGDIDALLGTYRILAKLGKKY